MLYKHWKKVLLSLTAFFWASCDTTSSADDGSETPPIDNPDPRSSSATEGADTSSASTTPESSAEAASSADEAPASSSSEAAPASSDTPNVTSSDARVSSSETIVAPKYGVPMSSSMIAAKYGVIAPSSSSESIAPKYGVMFTCERKGKKIACEDGVTCTEEETETAQVPECSGDQICAKYGVVYVKETTYKCDDGRVYNYAEFQSKYTILDGAVDLYGCPSDICGPDTTFEEAEPLYGIPSGMTNRPN